MDVLAFYEILCVFSALVMKRFTAREAIIL